ncbi:uncharacterized protein [Medicago truncatula]|uniref:uncharacterized protein n=1 Tax=Medicago truncatula TaxID=3880 RepID=UPI00023658CB|nr:uncharacterized protein LOC112422186 [Medicago truncatula]
MQANSRSASENQLRSHNARPHKPPNRTKWKKPEEDFLKANCDANLQVKGWWGLGSIIRNENGLVMASAAWKIKGTEEVILAEAFSLLSTVRLAIDCGFRQMIFEGDNEKVFRTLKDNKIEDRSYLGSIIKEIQRLQFSFDKCQFNFIPGECNTTAHSMAQVAHSNPNSIWIEEVPTQISAVYFKDLLN